MDKQGETKVVDNLEGKYSSDSGEKTIFFLKPHHLYAHEISFVLHLYCDHFKWVWVCIFSVKLCRKHKEILDEKLKHNFTKESSEISSWSRRLCHT